MNFCVQTPEWQYLMFPIVPSKPNKTVKTVQVMSSCGRNPNTVLFDNLTLTREDAQSFAYNANGDLVSVTQPGTSTPSYSYSGADLISQVTRGSGTYQYSYDNRHNVTGVSNDGLSMATTYDSRGNATGSTLTGTGTSLQIGSSASYDSAGDRLLSQTDARGNSVSYAYGNAMSQMLGQPGSVTDPLGIVSTTSHNADNGRVTGSAVLDGNDTVASLSYTYASGRLSAMTRTAMLPDATSFTQSCGMSYNAFGQTTGVSVGTIPLASYVYGANGGLLQSMSYGNGDSVEYAYDALARVRDIYYNESSTPSLHYGYAANGALGSLTDLDNDRLSVYGYDGLDRLLSMRESFDGDAVQVFRANYDAANRVSGTGYRVSPGWDGTLGELRSYGYTYSNTNGSLSSLTLPGGGTYAYSYDALRRLSSRALSVGSSPFLTREYGYLAGAGTNDTTTLVSTLQNKAADGSTINAWTYTYDAAGRITSVTGDAHTRSYTYDAQGQLLCESASTGFLTQTWSYTYDTAGNLRSATRASSTSIDDPFDPGIPIPPTPTPAPMGGGADEQPRRSSSTTTVTYSYGNAQWPDLLTAYDGNSIVYDAIGNPTTWYDGAVMTWVKGRQLASIGATGEHAALSFSYNADGLRLTKTVGTGSSAVTHRYTWQGGRLIAEAYGDTELEFFYDESGQPYALLVRDLSGATPTEAWYYYVTNLQGDVVMLLDESGDAVAEYDYNAWGELIGSAGTMADLNPIRYRGYYFDAETGLYYVSSRYYDPEICRWINADSFASTGQGIVGCNMFAYCNNSSVASCDPSGMMMVNTVNVNDGGGNQYKRINSQSSYPYNNIPYGNSTIGYAGCEPIACYNTLISLGKAEPFNSVKDFFVKRFNSAPFSGWGMGGHWGAMPSDIEAFLESKEIDYIQLSRSELLALDYYGPAAGNYILCYWNGMPFLSSYHTIAVECTGYNYTAYNFSGEPTNLSIFNYIPKNTWHYINLYRAYYIPMQ